MTVISTTLSKNCTVHVTDSLLRKKLTEQKKYEFDSGCKFAKVSEFHGAMSWFGRVYKHPWDAIKFLQDMSEKAAKHAGKPDDFGRELAEMLNRDTALLKIREHVAMGVHFSFYEVVDGQPVPEMLFVTNYSGITDTGKYVMGKEFVPQRQTFFAISKDIDFDKHAQLEYRRIVAHHLQEVGAIEYNNGNPALFNAFDKIRPAVLHYIANHQIDSSDILLLEAKTAQHRVEAVAHFQEKFFKEECQLVGNPCYYLQITPDGQYLSNLANKDILGK